MAMKRTKGKKKWFAVIAPEIYDSKELSEITAYEPTALIGRPVECYLSLIYGPKEAFRKCILKITEVKGEKAITSPWKYYLQESYIQRASRRFRERFICVKDLTTKDGKKVHTKVYFLIAKRIPRSLRAKILKRAESWLVEKFAKINSKELFVPKNLDKLSEELKAELKSLYPINKILFWKLTILNVT